MVHRAQTAVLISIAAAFATVGCAPAPEYPPPSQKIMPSGPEPLLGPATVRMSDLAVDSSIVKDVLQADPGSAWRWTNQNPRVRIWFDRSKPQVFYLRFTLAGVILKQVGPLTIRMIVNDKVLDTRRFEKEQHYEYSNPVPAAALGVEDNAILGLDIDPVYVSPRDGVKLGVLLEEIGLKPAGAE